MDDEQQTIELAKMQRFVKWGWRVVFVLNVAICVLSVFVGNWWRVLSSNGVWVLAGLLAIYWGRKFNVRVGLALIDKDTGARW